MNVLNRGELSRISISLPSRLLHELDQMLLKRGFDSRSQAIVEMINQQLVEHKSDLGFDVMAGTINLVYDHSTTNLQKDLADLQHKYVDEVISSLHVHLMDNQTMEVILVQGPATKLQMIADQMISCSGVITGRLQLTTTQIPPLHPLP
ncbi:MAG: nickel-responsive transcriptional regulator NikR [Gammaproteobacteria bacterium 28-57-27]|nr:MAG: nickel-responsive transcriptional regulator NikR [Gammaproteobacteria bacterium 28-57-27]